LELFDEDFILTNLAVGRQIHLLAQEDLNLYKTNTIICGANNGSQRLNNSSKAIIFIYEQI